MNNDKLNEVKECYNLLKRYHRYLTRQQLLTLKGQIKANDIIGFKKGLKRLLDKKIVKRVYLSK